MMNITANLPGDGRARTPQHALSVPERTTLLGRPSSKPDCRAVWTEAIRKKTWCNTEGVERLAGNFVIFNLQQQLPSSTSAALLEPQATLMLSMNETLSEYAND